jgi:lysophospholipase L1-like esterase
MGRRGRFRANVLPVGEVDPHADFPSNDPTFFDHLLLAEGDSWFSIGGFPPSNLLYGLRFRRRTMVASCASPGDTVTRMAEIARNEQFTAALSRDGFPWTLILLSGGGNDLIGGARGVVLAPEARSLTARPEPADYCDEQALRRLLDGVDRGFRTLAARRDAADSPARGRPIVTHTYDYPTPRNEPARFAGFALLGPWLHPAFEDAAIPERDRIPLAGYLMDRLAETILGLARGPGAIGSFHVVDTRGTLTPARPTDIGPTTHWLNEIHPTADGYGELARRIERERLYPLLYGGF